jgi:hypothetical protein
MTIKEKEIVPASEYHRWTLPADGLIKINIDGAFVQLTRQGGWGFVAQDSTGEVRGSGAGRLTDVALALQSEAIACFEAVQAAAEWGMGHILVETDCQVLTATVKTKDYDLAPEGVIFREIRSFLQLNFISFDILFCLRICNKLSHTMAAWGANQTLGRCWWPDLVPDVVRGLVASKCAAPV